VHGYPEDPSEKCVEGVVRLVLEALVGTPYLAAVSQDREYERSE
jgi:hypothetical protein